MAGKLLKLAGYVATGRFDRIAAAVEERMPRSVYYRATAYIVELTPEDRPPGDTPAKFPAGYDCRLAKSNELGGCAQVAGLSDAEFTRRFEAGDLCLAVFSPNGASSVAWSHEGPFYVRGMGYLGLAGAGDRYVYGVVTAGCERRKGLSRNGLKWLTEHLFSTGATRLIGMVLRDNIASLSLLSTLGYRRTKVISHVKFLCLKRLATVDLAHGTVETRWFLREPPGVFVI